jgi:FKBP-type peptidyl-prolyl cis-trans isomerase SlyD
LYGAQQALLMIKENSVVTMHYELKDSEGEILDSSKGQEPLVYLHGAGNIIVGLEEQLVGKVVGDNVAAIVSPEKSTRLKSACVFRLKLSKVRFQ